MSRVGMGVVLLLAALQSVGCVQDHARPDDTSSSGSNWLRCQEFADCSGAAEAVVCRSDGFCVDARGERIAAGVQHAGAADAQVPADAQVSDAQVSLPPSEGGEGGTACAWDVDALLEAAGASAPDRRNCGAFGGYGLGGALTGALRCYDDAVAAGQAVQISFNRCVDCWIRSTYVATAAGEFFEVIMEHDSFGDQLRSSTVRSCDDIVSDPTEIMSCSGATMIYECSGPRATFTPPQDPLVEPYKLTDVAFESAAPRLHLYVSNQSFAEPLVDIAVEIDDTQVVVGDFAVEGQHNWYAFDIAVPSGTLELYAVTFGTAEAISFRQAIEVPAERWAVLDYWNDPGSREGRHFTLTVSDVPVSFE